MHHTFSFRRAFLFLLSFVITGTLSSQVKIREQATIAPAADTTHGANRQLVEKWKALTRGGVKINAVSPGKNKLSSLIGFANGGGLSVTVVDGASAASLDLVIRSPIQQVIVADANNNHGFTWDTTGLPGGILDIGLIWHYWSASGSEYGCSVQQVNDTTYMLGFEDTNYPPYFVDLIVKVVISPQPHDYHFDVTVIPDTIVYDDYANVSALLVDKDGNEVPLDDSTPVTLTATPENIGWFFTDNPVPYGDLKSGNVLYRAGGVEPLEPQDVTMAVDAGGITGQGKLVVTPKPCLVMQLSRTKVSPGDTVQVTFLALQYNGQLTPYPVDQLFYVWMNTDASFGTLQSGWGEQGAWLLGPQPFMFIATSSISADSLVVQLEAEPSSGGIATSVRKGPKLELQKQAKASVAKLMNIIAMKVRPASKELQSVKAPTANEGKTVVPQQSNTVALWREFRGINRTAQEGAACVPTGTVVVTKGSRLNGFVVRASKDTLGYRETADLTVIAIDKDSQEVAIDPNTPMIATFDDGGPFVDFIRATGDTVETILNNVTYSSPRSGEIKLVAAKTAAGLGPVNAAVRQTLASATTSPPPKIQQGVRTDFPKSLVMASMANDATKVGSKTINLKPAIKVIAVQDSIKPFYPDPSSLHHYVIDTTESRTRIKVAVTVSGVLYALPPPMLIKLTSAVVDSSGGHSHDTNRPNGYFGDSIRDTVAAIDTETGTDTVGTSYLASMFGGKERVIATLTSLAIADTDTVVVRVPRIVPLQDSSDYDKTGGRDEHHGPRLDNMYPNSRTPDNNHWIDSLARSSLQASARSFRNATWNTEHEKMRLNDISLPLGGGFDVYGQWRRDIQDAWRDYGHGSHRTGRDVDIENSNRLQRLRDALEANGWEFQKEQQPTRFPHFHYTR